MRLASEPMPEQGDVLRVLFGDILAGDEIKAALGIIIFDGTEFGKHISMLRLSGT